MISRSVNLALALYPQWWRERRGAEVRALVDDQLAAGACGLGIAVDLIVGAVRVRMNAAGMPGDWKLWQFRVRHLVLTATLPWLVLAPAAFSRFVQISSPLPHVGMVIPRVDDAARAAKIAEASVGVMFVAFLLAWAALQLSARVTRRQGGAED